jgi:hypothetical protein
VLGSAPLRRMSSERSRRVCGNRDGALAGITPTASGRQFRALIFKNPVLRSMERDADGSETRTEWLKR